MKKEDQLRLHTISILMLLAEHLYSGAKEKAKKSKIYQITLSLFDHATTDFKEHAARQASPAKGAVENGYPGTNYKTKSVFSVSTGENIPP